VVGKHNIFLAAEKKTYHRNSTEEDYFFLFAKGIKTEKATSYFKACYSNGKKNKEEEKKCFAVSINEPYKLGFFVAIVLFLCFCTIKTIQ
jgi:hypothetical protein